MLGDLLQKLFWNHIQKLSIVLQNKGLTATHLLYVLCGLGIFVFATFVSQFYAVGAILLLLFTLTYVLRGRFAVRKKIPSTRRPVPLLVAVASICLFLIGFGYDSLYITPVSFLIVTWIVWICACVGLSGLRTLVGTAEMVTAVIVMGLLPKYVPVITIFVGVMYLFVTGVAIVQRLLAPKETPETPTA